MRKQFFEEYLKVVLGKLLLLMYYFTAEDSQRRTTLYLGLNPRMVSSIYRQLQDMTVFSQSTGEANYTLWRARNCGKM